MVVHTSNSITGEAEAGEILGIQGHQELHSKNLSKTNKTTNTTFHVVCYAGSWTWELIYNGKATPPLPTTVF